MRRGIAPIACVVFLAFAGLFVAPRAAAQRERILDFHSDIDVRENADMYVRETIRIYSAGQQFRHGIFRDFPTRYKDRFGNGYVVGFHVVAAIRDGYSEPWRVQDLGNGERIYLGSANVLLPAGQHTYEIDYVTNRQLGFFGDHDELFWNATGNGWQFPIGSASATVHLLEKIPASDVSLSGYTGPQNSMEQDLTAAVDPDGSFSFQANHALPPRNGLTILLKWPKGYFVEPTAAMKFQYFMNDNRGAVAVIVGLIVLTAYYLLVWVMIGRGPQHGVIMPLYEPPDGFSPAAMRYLVRMGYDNKVLTAAILDMAVKGLVQIKEQAGSYTLYRTANENVKLTPDENAVAGALLDGRTEVWLHNENHVLISKTIAALKSWLKIAEEKTYFVTNAKYMIPGIVISSVVLLALIASLEPPKIFIVGFLCVWLSIWSIAVGSMVAAAGHMWMGAFQGGHLKSAMMAKAFFLSLFMLPFLIGEVVGITLLAKTATSAVVVALLATAALHVLFHRLLKRPTSAGRSVLDKIEGFKMFLGAVEGDRLNRAYPPEKTPEVFEKLLPYALALDVEQAWAQKFAGIIDGAGHAPGANSAAYSPAWYSGASWGDLGAAGFAGSLSGSFASAISSSSSAPGSAGGGGGGSGGGGGGGGGGGW